MAKAKAKEQPKSETTWVVYLGSQPQVTYQRVPGVGDVTLDRGKPVELPAAAAQDLIDRKKVRQARPPRAAAVEAVRQTAAEDSGNVAASEDESQQKTN